MFAMNSEGADESAEGLYPQLPPNLHPAQAPKPATDKMPIYFGVHPVTLRCPHCQTNVKTMTEQEPGALAWITAGVLCCVGYVKIFTQQYLI